MAALIPGGRKASNRRSGRVTRSVDLKYCFSRSPLPVPRIKLPAPSPYQEGWEESSPSYQNSGVSMLPSSLSHFVAVTHTHLRGRLGVNQHLCTPRDSPATSPARSATNPRPPAAAGALRAFKNFVARMQPKQFAKCRRSVCALGARQSDQLSKIPVESLDMNETRHFKMHTPLPDHGSSSLTSRASIFSPFWNTHVHTT
jgi:hypothetical protein